MKACELMRGDIVLDVLLGENEKRPCEVYEVLQKAIYVGDPTDIDDDTLLLFEQEYLISHLRHICPCPIDGDILTKAGWYSDGLYWWHKNCPFGLIINTGDGVPFVNSDGRVCFDFRHLHKLQQQLRVCGCFGLAFDLKKTFRIETEPITNTETAPKTKKKEE